MINAIQKVRNIISKILTVFKKVPETFCFLCTKDKILLNVWMQLSKDNVMHSNFGDDLNYYLMKSLTNKHIFNLSNILVKNKVNILAVGSIIESHTNKDSIIWGSGAMYGGDKRLIEHPRKVLAVRGPLTREYLLAQGIACPEVYGDPALLLPKIYAPQVCKKYKLGIIPHYVDIDSEKLDSLRNDPEVKIINLRGYDDWKKVIDSICECEFVVSSSLHGLIISDSYGIPNQWIRLSDKISGGNFKYLDYFMSVGRDTSKPLSFELGITKEELLLYKESYKPIVWDPQELLSVAPF